MCGTCCEITDFLLVLSEVLCRRSEMNFLFIFVAWLLFVLASVNLVAVAYRYIKLADNTLSKGDYAVLLRLLLISASFAGWYGILFVRI